MPDGAAVDGAAKRVRLAQRRKALGLTQEALANLLGVERSTVVRWERGETEPVPSMRSKLAEALRVSAARLDELLANGASKGAAAVPPRQLPVAVPGFAGRVVELAALTRILDDADPGAPGTVVISAIGGPAGVGKTALALHWAHQVAHRFPDGQLHVNLRGYDPAGTPAAPAEVIRGFLDALGVPPQRIPPSPEAQAGLYRSLLAGKRMLVVLDNARDEQQVRPLLPASPASLVIVTSRNQLTGLAAADGARQVSLDVLSHAEAVQLLTTRLGTARAAAEPGAIDEIASLCARLPLALAVTAARAATRPSFPLAALADELRDTAGRLDALDAGDPAASVRAVFSWSYHQLSPEAGRMFRLLGLHPGPDISVPAAASLAACAQAEARRLLRELARDCLIAEHVPGRYAFHDLLRAYAASQARECDSDSEREAAVGRVLDHYLHSTRAANIALNPSADRVALAPPRPGTTPEQVSGYGPALAWLETELQVLIAAVTLAARSGFDRHAWQLPGAMTSFLLRRGYGQECAAVERIALAAATRLGDTRVQAESSRLLAEVCRALGAEDQAAGLFAESLTLYRQLGDQVGEAGVQHGLVGVACAQGRHADALGHAQEALRVDQADGKGNRSKEANALNTLGWVHSLLGEYEQARTFCQRSLRLAAEVGNPYIEASARDSLGYVEHQVGDFGEAYACYQCALSILREFSNLDLEAHVLAHLGDTHRARGEPQQARKAWRRALLASVAD